MIVWAELAVIEEGIPHTHTHRHTNKLNLTYSTDISEEVFIVLIISEYTTN